MASKRQFKKDLNQTLSEVIEECYEIQKTADAAISKKAEKLIDGAIETFDQIIAKLHQEQDKDPKSHFKSLREELAKSTSSFQKEIEKLKS
ncbi:MAG: hypothetical protein WBV45_11155 [Lutimonas sp.]